MILHGEKYMCVIFFPILFFKKKKKSPKLKLALRTSHSWDDHHLTIFPPLTAQNSVQKGSPGFPEVQKRGAWDGHLLRFPTAWRIGCSGPGVGGREEGQAEP